MSTLIAIVCGMGLLLLAIMSGGDLSVFISIPSLMIVVGGTTAAIFTSFQLPRVLKVTLVLLQIFKKDEQNPGRVIGEIVKLSLKARQQSLLALEDDANEQKHRFIKLGLEMAIDGAPGDLIREVLETELDFIQVRHRRGVNIFAAGARYAPSFGLIGTLIGLVQMLQAFGSSESASASTLGLGMSVALITTFYGAMMANLFFSPVSEKLKSRTEDEVLTTRVIIEGIVMLQAGANPRIIEKKLNSYLPPELRTNHYEKMMKKQRNY